MKKFKVGDRVVVISTTEDYGSLPTLGLDFIITKFYSGRDFPYGDLMVGNTKYFYREEELELFEIVNSPLHKALRE